MTITLLPFFGIVAREGRMPVSAARRETALGGAGAVWPLVARVQQPANLAVRYLIPASFAVRDYVGSTTGHDRALTNVWKSISCAITLLRHSSISHSSNKLGGQLPHRRGGINFVSWRVWRFMAVGSQAMMLPQCENYSACQSTL
jgi:hypothetical protein